jgi:hypothetical protein
VIPERLGFRIFESVEGGRHGYQHGKENVIPDRRHSKRGTSRDRIQTQKLLKWIEIKMKI